MISCSKYNAHTEPLFKSLNLLKVEDIFKIKILKFFYKYSQKSLPLYFNEMFTKTSDRHNYGTRQQSAQILYKYPTRTDIGRKCIRHLLPEIVNKTQSCITEKVSTHSFNGFSTYKNIWLVTIPSIATYKTVTFVINKLSLLSMAVFQYPTITSSEWPWPCQFMSPFPFFSFFSSLLYMSYL